MSSVQKDASYFPTIPMRKIAVAYPSLINQQLSAKSFTSPVAVQQHCPLSKSPLPIPIALPANYVFSPKPQLVSSSPFLPLKNLQQQQQVQQQLLHTTRHHQHHNSGPSLSEPQTNTHTPLEARYTSPQPAQHASPQPSLNKSSVIRSLTAPMRMNQEKEKNARKSPKPYMGKSVTIDTGCSQKLERTSVGSLVGTDGNKKDVHLDDPVDNWFVGDSSDGNDISKTETGATIKNQPNLAKQDSTTPSTGTISGIQNSTKSSGRASLGSSANPKPLLTAPTVNSPPTNETTAQSQATSLHDRTTLHIPNSASTSGLHNPGNFFRHSFHRLQFHKLKSQVGRETFP